jgi:hypothetical protein
MAEDGMFSMLKCIKEKSEDQEARIKDLEVKVLQLLTNQ